MKKVILGAAMVLAGVLSDALLFAGSMANDWTIDGQKSALWNLSQYGLMPALVLFTAIAAVGFAIAVWGIAERERSSAGS